MNEYRRGQKSGFEIAMTVWCRTCFDCYYKGRDATNDIVKDGKWLDNDIRTGIHVIDGKKKKCLALWIIPSLALVLDAIKEDR